MPRLKPKCSAGATAVANGATKVDLKVTPTSRETARLFTASGHARTGEKGRAATFVTETLQHGKITPWSGGYTKGNSCVTKAGPPRRGQVDLAFVPRGKAAEPGPALRFCTPGGGFAPTVSVRDPREAKRIAVKYQSCMENPKAKVEACIKEATGKAPGPVAGWPSRRRRR